MSALLLMFAEEAVKYVEQIMPHAAGNKPLDLVHRHQRGMASSDLQFRALGWLLRLQGIGHRPYVDPFEPDPMNNIPKAWQVADTAKAVGVGNCIVQSMVAMQYLVDDRKLNHVGLFCIVDPSAQTALHTFVIIGISPDALSSMRGHVQYISLDMIPHSLLGTVWCDPWHHEWFAIHDGWGRRVRNIIRATSPNGQVSKGGYLLKCMAYYHAGSGVPLHPGDTGFLHWGSPFPQSPAADPQRYSWALPSYLAEGRHF